MTYNVFGGTSNIAQQQQSYFIPVTQVTVKVLDGHRVEDEDDFIDEVQMLSRLDHANITRLVGFVVCGRPWLIVTRLSTEGRCLRDHLRRGLVDTETATLLHLCRQMTSAVAYLAGRR